MPITGAVDGEGNSAGHLARINFLREEPGGSRNRLFVNALYRPLYMRYLAAAVDSRIAVSEVARAGGLARHSALGRDNPHGTVPGLFPFLTNAPEGFRGAPTQMRDSNR